MLGPGGIALLALHAFFAVGPNDYVLHRQLQAATADLPLAALPPPAGRLWVVLHERPEWPSALYVAADAAPPALVAAAGAGTDRLLPGLRVPRLVLRGAWHRDAAGRPAAVETMALDVAERYFNALLAARLDLDLPVVYRREAAARADALFPEIPVEERTAAYLETAADFASHLLSVGHELGRLVARGVAAGRSPCDLADPPRLLFARWGTAFSATDYRATYRPAGAGPDAFAISRVGLEREDKTLFLRRVLGVDWSGELRRDLPSLCP